MRSEILALHSEMRALTLESGVQESVYDAAVAGLDECSETDLLKLRDRLSTLRRGQYHGVLEIKRLLPQEVWDRYLAMGEESLREQRLLSERQQLLRRAWRGKRQETEQEGPDQAAHGERLRSEG